MFWKYFNILDEDDSLFKYNNFYLERCLQIIYFLFYIWKYFNIFFEKFETLNFNFYNNHYLKNQFIRKLNVSRQNIRILYL